MIPKIIHFVFGLREDFGGKPFSFIHFLAVYTAWKINRPDRILFHYAFEPAGDWWEKARPFLTLSKIEVPTEIFGNPLVHYAHRADIVRLEMLKVHGGIYLDLDVLCINPFNALLQHNFVMGIQQNTGLCNAVILAKPNAPFLRIWLEEYKNFDGRRWDFHSVELPFRLANKYPELCHIVHKDLFFYPTHSDPVHRYLFGLSLPLSLKIGVLLKNVVKLGMHAVGIRKMKPGEFEIHAIHGKQWHYRKLCKSYCIHLWESQWWERYLAPINPEVALLGTSNFCRFLRKLVTKEKLIALAANIPARNVPENG